MRVRSEARDDVRPAGRVHDRARQLEPERRHARPRPRHAEVDVEVLKENDILKGLPPKFKTWASHMDQVVQLPDQFEVLARSNVCEIEAMKHLTRPLYGVQWHPEVVHTEHGQELLDNFIAICKR